MPATPQHCAEDLPPLVVLRESRGVGPGNGLGRDSSLACAVAEAQARKSAWTVCESFEPSRPARADADTRVRSWRADAAAEEEAAHRSGVARLDADGGIAASAPKMPVTAAPEMGTQASAAQASAGESCAMAVALAATAAAPSLASSSSAAMSTSLSCTSTPLLVPSTTGCCNSSSNAVAAAARSHSSRGLSPSTTPTASALAPLENGLGASAAHDAVGPAAAFCSAVASPRTNPEAPCMDGLSPTTHSLPSQPLPLTAQDGDQPMARCPVGVRPRRLNDFSVAALMREQAAPPVSVAEGTCSSLRTPNAASTATAMPSMSPILVTVAIAPVTAVSPSLPPSNLRLAAELSGAAGQESGGRGWAGAARKRRPSIAAAPPEAGTHAFLEDATASATHVRTLSGSTAAATTAIPATASWVAPRVARKSRHESLRHLTAAACGLKERTAGRESAVVGAATTTGGGSGSYHVEAGAATAVLAPSHRSTRRSQTPTPPHADYTAGVADASLMGDSAAWDVWWRTLLRFALALLGPHWLAWNAVHALISAAATSAAEEAAATPAFHVYGISRDHPEVALFALEGCMAAVILWGMLRLHRLTRQCRTSGPPPLVSMSSSVASPGARGDGGLRRQCSQRGGGPGITPATVATSTAASHSTWRTLVTPMRPASEDVDLASITTASPRGSPTTIPGSRLRPLRSACLGSASGGGCGAGSHAYCALRPAPLRGGSLSSTFKGMRSRTATRAATSGTATPAPDTPGSSRPLSESACTAPLASPSTTTAINSASSPSSSPYSGFTRCASPALASVDHFAVAASGTRSQQQQQQQAQRHVPPSWESTHDWSRSLSLSLQALPPLTPPLPPPPPQCSLAHPPPSPSRQRTGAARASCLTDLPSPFLSVCPDAAALTALGVAGFSSPVTASLTAGCGGRQVAMRLPCLGPTVSPEAASCSGGGGRAVTSLPTTPVKAPRFDSLISFPSHVDTEAVEVAVGCSGAAASSRNAAGRGGGGGGGQLPTLTYFGLGLGFLVCTGLATWRLSVDYYFAWHSFQFGSNMALWLWLTPASVLSTAAYVVVLIGGHVLRWRALRQLRRCRGVCSAESRGAGDGADWWAEDNSDTDTGDEVCTPVNAAAVTRRAAATLSGLRWMPWCAACVPYPTPEVWPLMMQPASAVVMRATSAALWTALPDTDVSLLASAASRNLNESSALCEHIVKEEDLAYERGVQLAVASLRLQRGFSDHYEREDEGGKITGNPGNAPMRDPTWTAAADVTGRQASAEGDMARLGTSTTRPAATTPITAAVVGSTPATPQQLCGPAVLPPLPLGDGPHTPTMRLLAPSTCRTSPGRLPTSLSNAASSVAGGVACASGARVRAGRRSCAVPPSSCSVLVAAMLLRVPAPLACLVRSGWRELQRACTELDLHLPPWLQRVYGNCSRGRWCRAKAAVLRLRRLGTRVQRPGEPRHRGRTPSSGSSGASTLLRPALSRVMQWSSEVMGLDSSAAGTARLEVVLAWTYLVMLFLFCHVLAALLYFTWAWRGIVDVAATAAMFAADVDRSALGLASRPLPSSYAVYGCSAGQQVVRHVLLWALPPFCPGPAVAPATSSVWTMANQVALLFTLLNQRALQVAYLYISVALPLGFLAAVYLFVDELRLHLRTRRVLRLRRLGKSRAETARRTREMMM